ncbi:MAG: TolC family protein [Deltaproteobacteria bacterium]|nr:TolC family protein [Deltaproteobacteria bacterium]
MHVCKIHVIAPLLLLSGLAVPVQARAGGAELLLWQDVVDLVEGHPVTDKTMALQALAVSELSEAKQYPNPKIGVGVGYGDPTGGGSGKVVWDLELTVPLEWIAERKHLKQQAEKGIEAAGYEGEALGLVVLLELRRMFVTIAHDEMLLASLEASEQHMSEFVATIKMKADVGDLRKVELTRVEIELAKVRLVSEKALIAASAHRARLDLWLGGKLPDDFKVDFHVLALPDVPTLEEAMDDVSSGHPLLKAGALKVEAAAAGVKAQKHAAFPEMAIGGFVEQELDVAKYGGLFTMSLPLWSWNKAGVDKAEAEKLEVESEEALVLLMLGSRVLAAHSDASQANAAAVQYRDEILPRARLAVEDVQKAYDEGDADLIDLIDARRTLVSTQIEYAGVLLELHLAVADLEILTGGGVS